MNEMQPRELMSVAVLAVGVVLHSAWAAWVAYDADCRREAEAEVGRWEERTRSAERAQAQAAVLWELEQAGACAPSSTWSSALRCGGADE